jgi:predicted transposase/invertase (TIGR01784 family)
MGSLIFLQQNYGVNHLTDKILLPISDIIFKLLFGSENSVDILKDFLMSVLDIPADDYEDIIIVDPHLLRQHEGDKLGILDVKVKTKSKKVIDIEIQVKPRKHFKSRVIYCLSKMITEQMGSGKDYSKIQRAISIIITDFTLIPENDKYHNRYNLYDRVTGSQFSDIIEINTLELSKLPEAEDGTGLWAWLKFLNAKSKEEFDMVATKNPQIKEAVARLEELSQDERTRMLYESRQLYEWDIALDKQAAVEDAAISAAKNAMINVAKSMLEINRPIDEILKITKLTHNEIENIHNTV